MKKRPAGREPFFHDVRFGGQHVPSLTKFPFNLPAFVALRERVSLPLHPAVTFLIGENGSGKSTLMEAIAVRLDFDETGGEAKADFGRRDLDGGLHDAILLQRSIHRRPADKFFLRAETAFDLASDLDRQAKTDAPWALNRFGGMSLHSRSHGEAFLAIVQNRLQPESFLLLDEPESALSPQRQLTLLKEMDWLVRSGCQFIIATHSPILMAYPDAIMYELGTHGIRETTWKETEHYLLTKSFLDHPEHSCGT